MSDFVSPEITASASSIPTVQKFNELSVGSGGTMFKANAQGVFVGGTSYSNAPYVQDYTGKISIKDSSGNVVILIDPNG